jgi:methyl-accepting chemotaxis protein
MKENQKMKSEEIDSAIAAHGQWKQRLKTAIETGQSEFDPSKLALDNYCDFGKWLNSLGSDIKATDSWKNIKQLHAEFHKKAASILDLAVKGKSGDASKQIELGSDYSVVSSKLTNAMIKWKKEII